MIHASRPAEKTGDDPRQSARRHGGCTLRGPEAQKATNAVCSLTVSTISLATEQYETIPLSAGPGTAAFVTVHGFPRRIQNPSVSSMPRSNLRFLKPFWSRPIKHNAAKTMVKTACQTVLIW